MTNEERAQALLGNGPLAMPAYNPTDFYSGGMTAPTSNGNGGLVPTNINSVPSMSSGGSIDSGGNHIYGEALDMTPAERAAIINGSFDAIGYDGTQFNAPGGKVGKLPLFQPSSSSSAYANNGTTGSTDLSALEAIAGMASGYGPGPLRDPRTRYSVGAPAKGDPWETGGKGGITSLRGPIGTQLNHIPGMVTGARPVMAGTTKAAQVFSQPAQSGVQGYLSAQGVDTSGMTVGQQQNAFDKGIRGGGNGQWY
jgi:hypothetical protein